MNQDLQPSELREVIYGSRRGQYGYFIAHEVGNSSRKNSIDYRLDNHNSRTEHKGI